MQIFAKYFFELIFAAAADAASAAAAASASASADAAADGGNSCIFLFIFFKKIRLDLSQLRCGATPLRQLDLMPSRHITVLYSAGGWQLDWLSEGMGAKLSDPFS